MSLSRYSVPSGLNLPTHMPVDKILNSNFKFLVNGNKVASRYAALLLKDLGATVLRTSEGNGEIAVNRWRESGLENLTGFPEHALDHCPIPIAEYGDGALQALDILFPGRLSPGYRGAELMSMRATMTGDTRRGDISVGGSCRLIPCRDGEIALSLPRDCDWDLLEAWLLTRVEPDWRCVAQCVRELPRSQLLDQGRLLGLAVATAEPVLPEQRCWYELCHRGKPSAQRRPLPRVIDLSSLWAGPLCGRLLEWCGAEVIKVESSTRPDGARFGFAEFFQFLNEGKTQVTLDLHSTSGVAELLKLIHTADIVIEASRPRALRQMGIIAEDLIDAIPGLTWIGISGYGRTEPQANWIAYGDDAGVAGGLSAEIYQASGKWMFCGDAIADPLTGMHAALAGYGSWLAGGGHLLSLSLVQTSQNCVLTHRNQDT